MIRYETVGLSLMASLFVACSGPEAPEGQTNVTEVVFDDGARAWVNREPDATAYLTSVYWQAAGGAPQLVRLEVASQRGLALASEGLYFVDEATLFSWRSSDATLTTRYAHNGLPTTPVLDNENVYFASTAFEPGSFDVLPHVIQAFPRDGGDPVVLYEREDQVLQIVVDDAMLYWVEMGNTFEPMTIWRAPKAGGGTPELLHDLGTNISAGPVLYASSDRLFWWFDVGASYSHATIESSLKDGSDRTTLIEDDFVGAGLVYAFEPDAPRLFGIAVDNPATIVEWPLDGGAPTTVATCAEYCGTLTSVQGRIMWADATGIHPEF